MKKIPLTQGKFALVDDEDFEKVNQFRWYAHIDNKTNTIYAYSCGWLYKDKYYPAIPREKYNKLLIGNKRKTPKIHIGKRITIRMHRLILGLFLEELVDHRDNNGLNNQKNNLRLASKSTNGINRGKQKNNTSGYKGVSFDKRKKKWFAQISFKGKHKFLGYFLVKKDAAKAYNKEALALFGEFAKLNIIS